MEFFLSRTATKIASAVLALTAVAGAAPVPVATITLGPQAVGGGVAANSVNNRIYAVDESSSSVVELDGTTNVEIARTHVSLASPGVPTDSAFYIAVNTANNRYVVAGGHNALVFDGATDAPLVTIDPPVWQPNGLPFPVGYDFMSVNEVTNKAYSTDTGNIFVTDLAAGTFSFLGNPFQSTGDMCTIRGLAINPANNWVYVTSNCLLASPLLFVVDATTGATLQTVDLGANIPLGANVGDIALNPISNKLYVVNYGGFSTATSTAIPPSTEVYNAVTFAHLASIPNVIGPLAVDTGLNAIYAMSGIAPEAAVIDGSADILNSTFPLGFSIDSGIQPPSPIAVNQATHQVYYVNSAGGSVSVFQGSLPSPGTFTVSGQLSGSGAAGVTIVAQGGVTVTAVTDANGAYTLSGLPPGAYVISPTTPGLFYSPGLQSVNVTTANVTGVNFVALNTPIAVTGLSLSPWSAIGSGVTTNATVTLNQPAPPGDIILSVSANAKPARVPATVTVPASSTSATFSVQGSGVNAPTTATITAAYQGSLAPAQTSASANVTVSPTDKLHIGSATYSRSSKILNVTATSTNPQAILTLFLASNKQNLGTLANQGGGNYSLRLSFTNGTPASIDVKSNLGGSTGQGVAVLP